MKKLNQTQALAKWMKSGKWITGKTAYNELRITRLPEIMRRLIEEVGVMIESETVSVKTIYKKTHIKKWRVRPTWVSDYKVFLKIFLH